MPESINMKKNNEPEEKFEPALKRLENTLTDLERGELGLEESIEKFREGTKLYKICLNKLESARQEIKVLTRDLEGNIQEEALSREA